MADGFPIALIGNEDYASEEAAWEILLAYNRRTTKRQSNDAGETWRNQPDANDRCKPIFEVDLDCGLGAVARGNVAPIVEAICVVLRMRIVPVSLFGTFWGIAAALWQARQKKIGKLEIARRQYMPMLVRGAGP
jgi:hypothetical protein